MRASVRSFVGSLSEVSATLELTNPYHSQSAAENLERFLSSHDPRERTLLFVGEAPGYRGAVQSGVPLCSLSVLLDDWNDPWRAFGSTSGYQGSEVTLYWKEATASIFWNGLAEACGEMAIPLTWNASPFHPTGLDGRNRSLRLKEVEAGTRWLEGLLDIFPNCVPIAVGRMADVALTRAGLKHQVLRHPSRGGKRKFREGLRLLSKAYLSPDGTGDAPTT
jgi:uracil-DNA glycosylase